MRACWMNVEFVKGESARRIVVGNVGILRTILRKVLKKSDGMLVIAFDIVLCNEVEMFD